MTQEITKVGTQKRGAGDTDPRPVCLLVVLLLPLLVTLGDGLGPRPVAAPAGGALLYSTSCCCTVLYKVLCCCTVLYNVLYCCIVLYNVLYCCIVLYKVLCCCRVLYNVLYCCIVLYKVLCCCTVLYNSVLCSTRATVLYNVHFRKLPLVTT